MVTSLIFVSVTLQTSTDYASLKLNVNIIGYVPKKDRCNHEKFIKISYYLRDGRTGKVRRERGR